MRNRNLSDAELLTFFGVDPESLGNNMRLVRELFHQQGIAIVTSGDETSSHVLQAHFMTPASPTAHVVERLSRDLALYTGRRMSVMYQSQPGQIEDVFTVGRHTEDRPAYGIVPMGHAIHVKLNTEHPKRLEHAKILGEYASGIKYSLPVSRRAKHA